MKEIVGEYWKLRSVARNHCDKVAALFRINAHEVPAGFFNMAYNDITLALELLDHYRKIWGEQTETNCVSIEEAVNQNSQRVVGIQKMAFIEILSAFEFNAKKFLTEKQHPAGDFNGRKYLKKIMQRSKDAGILSETDYDFWQGLIECRNTLVHNNGISEVNAEYRYPTCTLYMEKDKTTRGNLRLFPSLTQWLLNASFSWIISVGSN